MFSGIVEEMGTVVDVHHSVENSVITIKTHTCFEGVIIGDSVAVNGVCLTVRTLNDQCFVFDAMPETIRITTLGTLAIGDTVNLERSLVISSRVGGHMVQGHVDGTSTIHAIEPDGSSLKIWFKKLAQYNDCFIPKGFISVDGMSLTIVDVTADLFSICFIPHTQAVTVVQNYKVGTYVNVEVDHIAKTLALMLQHREYRNAKHS